MSFGARFPLAVFSSPCHSCGAADAFELQPEDGPRLVYAMMVVQLSDFFYAQDGGGTELFGEDGTPLEGDITRFIFLWDAGT